MCRYYECRNGEIGPHGASRTPRPRTAVHEARHGGPGEIPTREKRAGEMVLMVLMARCCSWRATRSDTRGGSRATRSSRTSGSWRDTTGRTRTKGNTCASCIGGVKPQTIYRQQQNHQQHAEPLEAGRSEARWDARSPNGEHALAGTGARGSAGSGTTMTSVWSTPLGHPLTHLQLLRREANENK